MTRRSIRSSEGFEFCWINRKCKATMATRLRCVIVAACRALTNSGGSPLPEMCRLYLTIHSGHSLLAYRRSSPS